MSRSAFPKAGVLLPLVLFFFASTLSAAAVKLSSITVNPNSVTGGNGKPTCIVTLTSAVGKNGAVVTVTSSNTSAVASTTISVPPGQASAAVLLTTFSIQANANVTLTASMNGSKDVTTIVAVLKPSMAEITCSSSQVAPGETETLFIRLNVNAPPGGTAVSLSSTSPAAPVPASFTIPAGIDVAQLTITAQQVSANTPVTISASAYGTTVQGSFVIVPACSFATQPQPTIPLGDHVWVDDTSGGNSPEVSWDTTQAASGTQSLTMPAVAPNTQAGFAFGLPTATTINSGDAFVAYVLLDPCDPPVTVGFTWSESAIGRLRGAYWGQTNPQWDSTGWWTHVGPLPAAGSWARLTFESPIMAGGTVDVSNTYQIGGKAWYDHYGTFNAGSTCTLARQPQPTIPPGDQVWVDDTAGGLNPPGGVYWDTTQAASGMQSLTMAAVGPTTETDFAFALPTATTINSGDTFVMYVLLDPCAPPATVGFTWSESAIGRVRGAYWGAANAQWDSTGWWTHVGPLPAAGSWARLTFNSPEMAGGTVDVSNTFWIGGKAWFDHYGTFNAGCVLATQPQPTIPAGDQVWVDDTSGGNSPEVSWDTTQAASGMRSLTMPALGPTTYAGFAFGLPTATTINSGDTFVAYVLLDPCNPPATVGFTWSESAIGRVRGAYWGAAYPQWDASGIWTHVGPLPAAGSWARLSFNSPEMAGGTVDVSNTYQIGGKAWYDHYGTFNAGSACTFGTQPKPTIPAGDQVWVDDTSGGNSPEVSWDTTQAASGTQSLTMPEAAPGVRADFAFGLPTATTINAGDAFVVYVLLDPCAPPTTVGFTWSESAIGRLRGAYWGATNTQWDSTGWWTHVGPLPAAGSWTRLTFESPIMAGGTVDVSNTFQYGGKAWYDHYGTFRP